MGQNERATALTGRTGDDLQARLVESSLDCIKVLDLDGRLLSMNAAGMATLEICDLAPLVGNAWIEFWEGADREAARGALAAARAGGVGRFVGFFPTTQTRAEDATSSADRFTPSSRGHSRISRNSGVVPRMARGIQFSLPWTSWWRARIIGATASTEGTSRRMAAES